MPDDLQLRIAAYLRHRMPAAAPEVWEVARIHGGSSQETYRLRARWEEAGTVIERPMVLRRVPLSGTVIVEQDLEATVYAALESQDLPVPKLYFHEPDPAWLDRPFFMMELCSGAAPAIYEAQPYGTHAADIARQFWRYLGRLAAIDHRAIGLQSLRNGEASTPLWQLELARWERVLLDEEGCPEPIVHGAIRWLYANPPAASTKPAIAHGDYRSGNFLFTPEGRITAILDWEMCHIGDPLEDVAWALDTMWSIARYLPEEEGLAIWEQASGLRVDPATLDWWRVFAAVKGCAIWTTAEAALETGRSHEMVVAGSAVRGGHFHRKALLSHMASRHGAA